MATSARSRRASSLIFLSASWVGAASWARPARAQEPVAPLQGASPAHDAPSDDGAAREVTVQGSKVDALKRASGSGTTIGKREIRNAQPESNAELLKRVPGMQVRTEDPMGFRLNLGVRGLSPARSRLILMEEDGVPVVVSPNGEPELYYTPMVERVERIDVLKGSDVLRYGPQTVGAVVQLHTWQPTERRGWYVGHQLGSRGYGSLVARYSDTSKDVGYVAQVVRKSGDGYRNMGFHATDAFGKAVLTGAAVGQLSLKLGFHDEFAHTTYTGLTQALYRQDPRRDTITPNDYFAIRRYEASLQHVLQFGERSSLRTSLFAYEMQLNQRSQDFDRSVQAGIDYASIPDPAALLLRNTDSLRDRVYDVAGLSSELEHHFQTGKVLHRLRVGVRAIADVARRQLTFGDSPTAESGTLQTDDTTRIFGVSGWLEDQIAFTNHFLVTPAFRYEHSSSSKTIHRLPDSLGVPRAVHVEASSHAGGAMPGVGVIYGTAKLNAFGSFYLGYSAPRVSQAITPNGKDADLHAERSRNYELGARARSEWLRAEADAFLIQFDNQLVSNNPLNSDSEFVDGGRTRHLGAEATAALRIGKGLKLPLDLDLAAQYTFVRARFVGGDFGGRTVPYSPVNSLNMTLDAAHPSGVSAQVALSYI
ncbi:MAG: TonB-dependent receptor, partial [Polyangiaceae bacterium]